MTLTMTTPRTLGRCPHSRGDSTQVSTSDDDEAVLPDRDERPSAVVAKQSDEGKPSANLGVGFINFGLLPSLQKPRNKGRKKDREQERRQTQADRQGMRQTIEDCLKKTPAQIIGLAECERRAEELLKEPPYSVDKTAPKTVWHIGTPTNS